MGRTYPPKHKQKAKRPVASMIISEFVGRLTSAIDIVLAMVDGVLWFTLYRK